MCGVRTKQEWGDRGWSEPGSHLSLISAGKQIAYFFTKTLQG